MIEPADRYVIAEVDGSGHRFWYVSLMLRWLALNAASADISLVTTRAAQDLPEWQEFIAGPHREDVDVVLVESRNASIDIVALLLEGPSAKLVIPDGDQWLGVLAKAAVIRHFRPQGTLLIMRPFRARGIGGTTRHLGKLALIKSLAVLSPRLRVLRLAPGGTRTSDSGWIGDPVEFNPRDVAREDWYARYGLTADRQYLAVMGDLTQRKFVPELLKAFETEPVGNWHLALVGRLGAQEKALVAARPTTARYSVIEGLASDQDFDTWIMQADAVAVLHRNEGASGILGKCAAAGVPVMVGGAKSLVEGARSIGIPLFELSSVDAMSISRALPNLPTRNKAVPNIAAFSESDHFVAPLMGLSAPFCI